MEKAEKRNDYFDFLKGILIFLVICGHVTASLNGGVKTQNFELFSGFTVSFIMPLFIMISGYFAVRHRELTLMQFIKKKFLRLLKPAVIWGGGYALLKILLSIVLGNSITITYSIKTILEGIGSLWFLYAIFISSILWFITYKFFDDNITRFLICVITTILIWLVPSDKWYIGFAYPFYFIGCFIYLNLTSILKSKSFMTVLMIICYISYTICLKYFNYSYSVYEAGINIWTNSEILTQIAINVFRLLVGTLGSICIGHFLYCLIKYIKPTNCIINLFLKFGRVSLELYILQFLVVEKIFYHAMIIITKLGLNFTLSNPVLRYIVWRHFFGFILTLLCYWGVKLLKRTKLNLF